MLSLYSYYRSSASYRVRIALHLKSIPFQYIPVHLVKSGGEQFSEAYKSKNPMSELPCIEHDGQIIAQSMAILLYLDECFPEPVLLPKEPAKKAKIIQACEIINSGIQPIQNLKVLKYLTENFNLSQDDINKWVAYWIDRGFTGLETFLKSHAGDYSFGNELSLCDLFLVPQTFNAIRYKVDMQKFPTIHKIHENCNTLEAFQKAHPSNQPDTPDE